MGAAIAAALLVVLSLSSVGRLAAAVARIALYVLIPWGLSEAQGQGGHAWLNEWGAYFFQAGIVAWVVLAILVIRFTRRQGFRTTPLDLLVLFVVLGLVLVAGSAHSAAVVVAEAISLFFVCEVIVTERRGELRWMKATTLAALAMLALRAFV
jgi:hypothetical protein